MSINVTKGRVRAPRKVLLYGVPGVGKSTWASQAPNNVFLPTEEGTNDLDVSRFPLATSLTELMSFIAQLYTEEHSFKWVTIDTVDWLEKLIWKEICGDDPNMTIAKACGGYGKGFALAARKLSSVLEGLDALRVKRSMSVILLAHAAVKRFDNPETDPYDTWRPRLHEEARALVCDWCDEVFFANYRTYTTQSETSNSTRAIGNGERIIKTTSRPTAEAKNRLALDDEIEMNFEAYASQLKGE